ncbi:MAG: hypothetical protein ABIN74_07155, partial [Ferruginibacter sp.]
GTYIAYGSGGKSYYAKQSAMDAANTTMSKEAGLKRIKAKSNGAIYKNDQWDLVDAKASGTVDFSKLDKKELPDSLKNKSTEEIKKIVDEKSKERVAVQKEITTLNTQRDAYIAAEKAKNATTKNNAATLETEVERIIKEQARRYKMVIQ